MDYRHLLLILCAGFLLGCDQTEPIVSYDAPKETRPAPATRPIAPSPAASEHLHWQVPAGWTAQPAAAMRYAAFAVDDAQPPLLLTVIPLGAEHASMLQANINRWEQQLGLPHSSAEDLPKVVRPIRIGAVEAQRVELTAASQRLLGLIIPGPSRVWFFKLAGPTDRVTAQEQNFNAFIQSITFDQQEH